MLTPFRDKMYCVKEFGPVLTIFTQHMFYKKCQSYNAYIVDIHIIPFRSQRS